MNNSLTTILKTKAIAQAIHQAAFEAVLIVAFLAGVFMTPFARADDIAALQKKAAELATQKMDPEQEWACTIILCLANPNGWSNVKECVPPVKKLFRHLKKGRPFPTCLFSGDSNKGTGSFARNEHYPQDRWPVCDAGLTPLNATAVNSVQYIATGSAAPARGGNPNYAGNQQPKMRGGYENITPLVNSPLRQQISNNTGQHYPVTYHERACVGKLVRTTQVCAQSVYGRCQQVAPVAVYDKIVWQKPQGGTDVINLFMDGQLSNRIFWNRNANWDD